MIGAGIETVLGLEDLYDLRRVTTLSDAAAAAASWPADVALVDGVLLEGRAIALGIPSYVLSGDAESGDRLADRLPGARGWLFKDATPSRLVAAIDRSLASRSASLSTPLARKTPLRVATFCSLGQGRP